MADITETEIEKFIRFPEALSEDRRRAIQQAIESSKKLQELADFFKEYNQLFHEIHSSPSRYLIPLNLSTKNPFSPESLILDKCANNGSAETLSTVTILTSKNNDDTLARISSKVDTQKYHIQVESNILSADEFSILTLRSIGMDFIVKSNGELDYNANFDLENVDWNSAAPILRLPVKKYSAPMSNLKQGEQISFQNITLTVKVYGRHAMVHVQMNQFYPNTYSRVLFEGGHTDPFIARLSDDSFAFPCNTNDDLLNICFLK